MQTVVRKTQSHNCDENRSLPNIGEEDTPPTSGAVRPAAPFTRGAIAPVRDDANSVAPVVNVAERGDGVFVVGAGGHAKVVVAALQAAGEQLAGVLDDAESKWGSTVLGVTVGGPVRRLLEAPGRRAVLAVGDNQTRRRLAEQLTGVDWLTVTDPAAKVHHSVVLGPGSVVLAGVILQPETIVGAHVIVNTGATVDHDCILEDFVHVAPGAHVAGGVRIGEGTLLGIGGVVIPGLTIGAWSTVGAGGVVVSDLSPGSVATGVPARTRSKGSRR